MIKKVTSKWLASWQACSGGIEWFKNQKETDPIKLIKKLIKIKQYSYANYSIVHLFNRKQKIKYAVFAAEQVIDIYEKEYPDDNRPRKAIEAAKACIGKNTEKNRAAVAAAGDAAWDAALDARDAAWAAWDAWDAWDARAAGDAVRDAVRDAAANTAYLIFCFLLNRWTML